MMVALSTITYDLGGFIEIKALASSSFGEISRRVNVVKTLDGGVAVNDGGSSHGDRSASILWKTKSRDVEDNIARVVESYSRLKMSTINGFFEVAPVSYNQTGAGSVMRLQILSKIA